MRSAKCRRARKKQLPIEKALTGGKAMKRSLQHPVRNRLDYRNTGAMCAARVLLPVLPLLLAVQAVAAQIPVVTSDSASQITSTNAVITGTVNPNGQPA